MFRRRIAAAILVSLAVILSAPFAQQLFTEVTTRWPARARTLGIAATAVPAAAVAAFALTRIRTRRLLRYAALVCAAAIGGGYIVVNDLTFSESFHFTEYGVIGLLFYRAWRPLGDAAVIALPMLAGSAVGMADEWFQWFIPIRAGEARDVGLNAVAIGCGVLLALAIDPPGRMALALGRRSRRHIGVVTVAAVMAFAVFFEAVHLGHRIRDVEIGTFESRYTWQQLTATRDARAAAWRTRPPTMLRRVSREDQYLSEGMFHVQWRNRMWTEGNVRAAWWENRILETYFAPVLDTPSFISATGHRWPPEQRADAEARAAADPAPYVSEAYPVPVYTWPRPLFWGAHLFLAALVIVLCRRFSS